MKSCQRGTRQTTNRNQLAKGYKDDQKARSADYFAQIKPVR